MKILHIGKYYHPVHGGIESVTEFIVNSLRQYSQQIVVYGTDARTVHEEVGGIPTVRVGCRLKLRSQPLAPQLRSTLRRTFDEFRPDVAYFHYPNPLGALRLLQTLPPNVKLVVHWHSDIVEQKVLYHLVKDIERRLLERADCIVGASPAYVEASKPLAPFINKTIVIPCAIDTHHFDLDGNEAEELRKLKMSYGGKPVVFFVGRHVDYKGISYLLEAAVLVKSDCSFVIAGTGPLTKKLKERYNSDAIHWVGRLSDKDLKLHYHLADVFAFPSITRNEAFGVVLAESMYCGCPAVTFTIPESGVNWVSPGDICSLQSPNRDIKALARAIDRLLDDRELHDRLSAAGRQRVLDNFANDVISDKYLSLIRKLSEK